MSAIVSLYTDFASAGGTLIGTLNELEGGEVVTRLDGDDRCTVDVSRARWAELSGTVRHVLRVTWPEGTVEEFRISRVALNNAAPTVQLEALPIFAELVTSGMAFKLVAGVVRTRVAGQLPMSSWLTTEVIESLPGQRIGLTLGTLDRDPVLDLDLDGVTPGAVVRDCMEKSGQEMEIVRNGNSGWILNARLARNSSMAPITVSEGRNLLALAASVNDGNLATVVVPLGEPVDDVGNRATVASVRYETIGLAGDGWVRLTDPELGVSPIQIDTQWVGAFLATTADGSRSQIMNSRASDGAVQLASNSAFTVPGTRVTITATADGAPQHEVYDSTAVAARGRRVVPVTFAGVRGEANEIQNGRFDNALAGWTGANPTTPPAFAEILKTELGVTRSGQANGARSAGTGTGTPFSIKGLPANSYVRQWAEIRVGGATLTLTADVIADTSGGLTFTVNAPGLPGSYAGGTPFSLVRKESRAFLLDGAHSVLATSLRFKDNNTDQLPNGVTGALQANSGGYVGHASSLSYETPGLFAGKVILTPFSASSFPSAIIVPTADLFQAWALFNPTIASDGLTATLDVSVLMDPYGGGIDVPTVNVTRIRWRDGGGNWMVCRVTGIAGSVWTLAPEGRATIVAPSTLMYSGGYWKFDVSNAVIADNTAWTFVMDRETRTLTLSGPHSAGAVTIVCTAQANLATRNWTSSDTITLRRVLTGSFDITSVGTVEPVTEFNPDTGMDEYIGSSLACVFAAGTSTMDDVALGDYPAGSILFQSGTSGAWALQSIVGTTANFFVPVGGGSTTALPTGVVSSTWNKDDTYALSGSASWGSNGRVTVTLAAPIPTGRSYARGLNVVSNWLSNSMRLHAAVSAGNTTVQIAGVDQFFAGSDPALSLRGAVYRVSASASTIPIPGNTLFAASTAQANGSGVASVTLTAANPNPIADNEAVTIATPSMLRPTDPLAGFVVRMMAAVGGSNQPIGSTAGLTTLTGLPVVVPAGKTVTVTGFATFSMSTGTYPLGQQPAIALVDSSGMVLGWTRLAAGSVQVSTTPTIVRLILSHTLTTSTTVFLRLYGGATDRTLFTVALDAMLAVTSDTTVPFVRSSWANLLAQRGTDILAARRLLAADIDVDLATLRAWSDAPSSEAPVGIGQTISVPAYGVTRRITSVSRLVLSPDVVRVELGMPSTDLSRRVAKLLSGGAA